MELSQLLSNLLEDAKERLKSITTWHEVVLVIGGALYLLGYIAWCIYAVANHLSLLPALSSQYIMAGGLFGSVFLLIGVLWRLRKGLLDLLYRPPVELWKQVVPLLILGAFLCNTIYIFLPLYSGARAIGVIVSLSIALLLVPGPGWRERLEIWLEKCKVPTNLVEWIDDYLPSIATVLFCATGFFLLYFAFQAIAQQFGGVLPQCASLFIEKDTLSPELRAVIIGKPAPGSDPNNPAVALPVQLDVLFAGGDTIFVRPRTSPPKSGDGSKPSTTVYEINRRIVQAVTWCD